MENILKPNNNFDFSNISLAHPSGIQGGAYFTKIQYNNKPLYIETPKSFTKQGFVKNGKKMYGRLYRLNGHRDCAVQRAFAWSNFRALFRTFQRLPVPGRK